MVVSIQVVLVALSLLGPVLVSTDLRDGKICVWSHVAQSVEPGAEKKTTMLIEADLISIVKIQLVKTLCVENRRAMLCFLTLMSFTTQQRQQQT